MNQLLNIRCANFDVSYSPEDIYAHTTTEP